MFSKKYLATIKENSLGTMGEVQVGAGNYQE